MKNYITELVGTFLFVFAIALAVISGSPMAPLAIGCALMCVVYMGGHISGAHYNPAVTLAIFLRGAMPTKDVAPYMVCQVLGATIAAFLAQAVTGKTFAPAPGADATTLGALLVEIIFTFMLALVVLNVATDKKVEGNSFYGLAIGFVIVVAAFAGGGISGGAFNPAVGIGPTVVHATTGAGMSHLWLYLAGPFVGGALAAGVYHLQHEAE